LSTEKEGAILDYPTGEPLPGCTENNNTVGYNANLVSLFANNKNVKHLVGDHVNMRLKYLIVLQVVDSTTGRLHRFLAHSGAVVLLQTHESEYHFSWRLKPWIHYVPVSYNIADIAAKVKWLNDHPRQAYQLAVNAKNFADSHLRLEDYYCYWGTAFKTLGDVYSGSDGVSPFNATKLIFN